MTHQMTTVGQSISPYYVAKYNKTLTKLAHNIRKDLIKKRKELGFDIRKSKIKVYLDIQII